VSNRAHIADLLCDSDQPLFDAFGSEADLARFARRSSKASLYEVAVEGDARPAKERRFTISAALLRPKLPATSMRSSHKAAEAEVEGLRKRIAELEAELADMRLREAARAKDMDLRQGGGRAKGRLDLDGVLLGAQGAHHLDQGGWMLPKHAADQALRQSQLASNVVDAGAAAGGA
jgi:hypothetical protein